MTLLIFFLKKIILAFIEDAKNYIIKITDFIGENILTCPSKTTPENLKEFGEKYIFIEQIHTQPGIYFIFKMKNGF